MLEGYFGLPGSGKSYAITHRALSILKTGVKVYSNFPIEGTIRIKAIDEVLGVPEGSYVVLDELQAWANSRKWEKFSEEAYLLFSQHRKRGLNMILASQHPSRIDVSIRELIHIYYWADNYFNVFFRYSRYYELSDMLSGNNRKGLAFLIKNRGIYSRFDTYFTLNVRNKKEVEWKKWDDLWVSSRRERMKEAKRIKEEKTNRTIKYLRKLKNMILGYDV